MPFCQVLWNWRPVSIGYLVLVLDAFAMHCVRSEFLCLSSAWIKVEQLKPYHAHKEEMIKINKGKRFQQAVDAVEDFLKKAKGKEQVRGCTPKILDQNKNGLIFFLVLCWLLSPIISQYNSICSCVQNTVYSSGDWSFTFQHWSLSNNILINFQHLCGDQLKILHLLYFIHCIAVQHHSLMCKCTFVIDETTVYLEVSTTNCNLEY